MTASGDLEALRARLNAADVLPGAAYRRNFQAYTLVCYVNCLIGAELSGRADVISLFAERIGVYMRDHPARPELVAYYDLIRRYVASFDER